METLEDWLLLAGVVVAAFVLVLVYELLTRARCIDCGEFCTRNEYGDDVCANPCCFLFGG